MVAPRNQRESMHIRMPPDMKRDVEDYAGRNGMSLNSATCQLVASALRLERLRDQADDK
jgi:hypothetical protein